MVGNYITLYRLKRVDRVDEYGCLHYALGDLRASIFGIRVPTEWALDKLVDARKLMFAARELRSRERLDA